tara:strand:- start:2707 stop:3249 length:543 start_codon:yes stop_codon:yes gene_type:complete
MYKMTECRFKKNNDLNFGDKNEKKLLEFFKMKDIHKGIRKRKYKMAILDYYIMDKKKERVIHDLELKSRRYKFKDLKDVCFGLNKYETSIERLNKYNIAQTYYFLFIDGLYKWELTDPIEQEKEIRRGMIANKARNGKPHPAIFVKNYNLELVDKNLSSQEQSFSDDDSDFLPDTDEEDN